MSEIDNNAPTGNTTKPFWMPNPWVLGALALVIFLILGLVKLSNAEVVLLGVVQTIFSLFVGWAITHSYAVDDRKRAIREIEEVNQKNLRTYALKAAEKVENLSRELNRLVTYLNQELEETDYSSSSEDLSAKEERIHSAIHILNTLKSVNDTSLSDWRGVIGDEIEEIRQRSEQREEALEKLVTRIQRLESQEDIQTSGIEYPSQLLREIDKLRRDIRFVAGDVIGNVWTARKSPGSARQNFTMKCPNCTAGINVRQKVSKGSTKSVSCPECHARLVSEIGDDGQPSLRLRRTIEETVLCSKCSVSNVVELDELIGASIVFSCKECNSENRASRAQPGVQGALVLKKPTIDEDFIEKVRLAMPTQPWPKGVHERVAIELGITATSTKKAIDQLILRGVFMDQFQGVLCTPAEKLLLMRSLGSEFNSEQKVSG